MLSSLKIKKKARCRHYHVSGRRCGSGESDRVLHLCRYHVSHKDCDECTVIRQSFIPPKGW